MSRAASNFLGGSRAALLSQQDPGLLFCALANGQLVSHLAATSPNAGTAVSAIPLVSPKCRLAIMKVAANRGEIPTFYCLTLIA